MTKSPSLKIAIIGAGFSGVSLVFAFNRLSTVPIEILLFEKTGHFGVGDAYGTPYPFHLLNVRASDMSAFEDDPDHFVNWIKNQPDQIHLEDTCLLKDQFVPRYLYGKYLKAILEDIQASSRLVKLVLEPYEVVNATPCEKGVFIELEDQRKIYVDKVVLAMGNNPPAAFPFPIGSDIQKIDNSWQYTSLSQINVHDPVLIIGTGLSMVDAVLTLYHQQHLGNIYALSRHGLLPLPHTDLGYAHISIPPTPNPFLLQEEGEQKEVFFSPSSCRRKGLGVGGMEMCAYPSHTDREGSCTFIAPNAYDMITLLKYVRKIAALHVETGGCWQHVMNKLRLQVPVLWEAMTKENKKRFLRHLLPYWNIHRHRVHYKLANLLTALTSKNQLTMMSGRVLAVENDGAIIKLRQTQQIIKREVKVIINCMGPAIDIKKSTQPLISRLLEKKIAMLDPLKLGFDVTQSGALKDAYHQVSTVFYTLGALRKGTVWECTAVPEIRKQSFALAKHFIGTK